MEEHAPFHAFDCLSESEFEDDDAMEKKEIEQSAYFDDAFSFPPEDGLNEPDVWEDWPLPEFHDCAGRNPYCKSLNVALRDICVGYFLSADHVFPGRMCCGFGWVSLAE